MRWTDVWGCALLVAVCGCGDSGPDPADETRPVEGLSSCSVSLDGYYYIAAALPFTGPLPVGESMEDAVLQALDEINEAGGIDGRPVGLVTCDSMCDAATARGALTELAGALEISGVVGAACSGATIPASEIAITEGIVMISPSATSPAITGIADDGWLNRTAPSDALQGRIVSAIAQREGLSNVFVINRDDPYGNGLREVFTADFTAGGGTTDFFTYDEETPGFADAAVSAAVAAAPDAVFMISFTTDGAAIAQTMVTDGFDPGRLLFPDGLRDVSFIETVADDAFLEGALGTIPASPTGTDFNTFLDRYRTNYGEDPGPFAANSYDAAYLLAIAMALSDDPEDRVQVRDNLQRTSSGTEVHPQEWAQVLASLDAGMVNYQGASGPVDLDANGDPQSNVEEWTITAGMLETVGCWTPDATACP